MQWQSYLLQHSSHSTQLRDAVAVLAQYVANTVVEWEDIRILIASCLTPLGEVLRCVLGKVVAMATCRKFVGLISCVTVCELVCDGCGAPFLCHMLWTVSEEV